MEIQALHAKLGRDAGHTMANRLLQLLSAVFNKAGDIGYTGRNPCEKLKRFPEESRDRYLQPHELPAFFQSLAHEPQANQDFFLVALLDRRRQRAMSKRCAGRMST